MSEHNEAVASANVKIVGQNGADILLTVRAGATVEDVQNLLDTLAAGLTYARERYHLTPKAGYSPAATVVSQAAPVGAGNMFQAEQMTATVNDGSVYWKVKGGPYRKWGVTIWPETLAVAGITDPDPLKPMDLTGYIAHIQMDGDKPKKVTRLERVQ